jgi:hypothetical protein
MSRSESLFAPHEPFSVATLLLVQLLLLTAPVTTDGALMTDHGENSGMIGIWSAIGGGSSNAASGTAAVVGGGVSVLLLSSTLPMQVTVPMVRQETT